MVVGLGLLVPAARADFVVQVNSLTGQWSASGNGIVTIPADGPNFGSIPAATGVQGFKMFGSANMLPSDSSDGPATLEATFQGVADGLITNPAVFINLQGTYEMLVSTSDTRALDVRLMIDLSLKDDKGNSSDAILDTSFEFTTQESKSFPFDNNFKFDLSNFLGFQVTGVSGLVSASTSDFFPDDSMTFSIPDSSLDFGVFQGNAVPEPSALALFGIGVTVMSVGGLAYRTGRQRQHLAVERGPSPPRRTR